MAIARDPLVIPFRIAVTWARICAGLNIGGQFSTVVLRRNRDRQPLAILWQNKLSLSQVHNSLFVQLNQGLKGRCYHEHVRALFAPGLAQRSDVMRPEQLDGGLRRQPVWQFVRFNLTPSV